MFHKIRYYLTGALFVATILLAVVLLAVAYADAVGFEPGTWPTIFMMVVLTIWLLGTSLQVAAYWEISNPGQGRDLPLLLVVLGLIMPVISARFATGLLYEYRQFWLLMVAAGPVLYWYQTWERKAPRASQHKRYACTQG